MNTQNETQLSKCCNAALITHLDSEKAYSWGDVANAPLVCEICGLLDAPETPDTATVLLEMLTENTGRSILDSGDAYGRAFERNQAKGVEAIRNEPAAYMRWNSPALSTFHYLNEHLSYAPVLDLSLKGFMAKSSDSYLEDVENWLDFLGVQAENDEGFYGSPRYTVNSYNSEYCLLDQTIQFVQFILNEKVYIALQIHGGADVRGGYCAPRVFEGDAETLICSWNDATLYCQNCELGLSWGYYEIEEIQPPAKDAEAWEKSQQLGDGTELKNWDFAEAGCPNCAAKDWRG